jgi:hypothetical protein
LAWLAIAVPIAALFGSVLVTDRSFAFRDSAHFYYPLLEWCCREWAAGRVPLWNPLENCGLPVLADTTSSVFYPGKLAFLLPIDFTLRYKLYVISHVVLAAATSYHLARAWKASSPAAGMAAIAFACGGNVVFQYCNVVFLVSAAWLPLAVLAADRMLRQRSWRWAVGFGVTLALMILGGDPQAGFHGLLIAGLYAIVLSFSNSDPDSRDQAGSRNQAAPESGLVPAIFWGFVLRISLVALAAAVGFALAAVQVLPSSEATKYSERAAFNRPRNIYEVTQVALEPAGAKQPLGETRSQSIARGLFALAERGSHQERAYDFSIGPWRLAEYVWPNIGGRMFPTNRRWFSLLPAEGRTWTPTLYLGLLPVVLALASFRLWSGSTRVRWLSILTLLFTLASLGYYGLGWLAIEIYGTLLRGDTSQLGIAPPVGGVYWLFVMLLPTYVYFRYPAKLLPLVSLGLSQLAAVGFDRAFAGRRPRLERVLLVLGIFSGAAAFVVWCIGPGMFAQVTRLDASLGPFDREGGYRDLLAAFVQSMIVALASRWLLTKAWSQPARLARWQHAVLFLTAVELAVANAWVVTIAPADLFRGESPVAAAIHAADTGEATTALASRVYRGSLDQWRPGSFRTSMSADRAAELVRWEHNTLFPKYQLQSDLALVESYGSVKLLDYESLLFIAKQYGPRQTDKTALPQPTALRMLSTEYLLLPEKQQPEFAECISDHADKWPENAALWRMTRTLPRTWIVHDLEVLAELPRPGRTETLDERTKQVLFPGDKPRNFLRSAVVETNQPLAEWSNQQPSEDAVAVQAAESCSIRYYNPQRVVVEAELARPGLLVSSDAWFPGWTATATSSGLSKPAPIYRTNRVLRGVWLPAGKHTVEYRFQPASFRGGAAISALSWLALAIFVVVLVVGGRHRGTKSGVDLVAVGPG